MSVGSNLQEMENAVTKGAAKGDSMQKLSNPGEGNSSCDFRASENS